MERHRRWGGGGRRKQKALEAQKQIRWIKGGEEWSKETPQGGQDGGGSLEFKALDRVS